jgi:hypothetical protein
MRDSSESFRGLTSRACERWHPLLGDAPVADRVRRTPMTEEERRTRALATWRTIDAETDTPERETRAKASRLAYVARDLQAAHSARARLRSAVAVIRYLMAVLHRSYGGMGFVG